MSYKYRKESLQVNLAGGYLLDRTGTQKISLSVKLNALTPSDVGYLKCAYTNGSAVVKFYVDNTLTTKTMILRNMELPSPIYYYGDRSNGIVYPSVTLSLEEM